MIIDMHTHIFKKAPYIGNIDREYSPELLVSLMEHANVNKAILISYEMKDVEWIIDLIGQPDRRIISKEYYIEAIKQFPDWFIWFTYGFDPKNENYLEVVKTDVKNGASGIKLFPSITGFSLEDSKLNRLFEFCQDKNLPVIISHEFWNNTSRPPYTNNYKDYKKIVSNLIEKYNKLKFLFCHLGCFNWNPDIGEYFSNTENLFKNINDFLELLSHPNVWTDIAAITFYYNEPYPYPTALELIKYLIKKISIDKFLFATDWPWTETYCTYKQAVDMIRFSNFLSNNQKDKFLGLNAQKFLEVQL